MEDEEKKYYFYRVSKNVCGNINNYLDVYSQQNLKIALAPVHKYSFTALDCLTFIHSVSQRFTRFTCGHFYDEGYSYVIEKINMRIVLGNQNFLLEKMKIFEQSREEWSQWMVGLGEVVHQHYSYSNQPPLRLRHSNEGVNCSCAWEYGIYDCLFHNYDKFDDYAHRYNRRRYYNYKFYGVIDKEKYFLREIFADGSQSLLEELSRFPDQGVIQAIRFYDTTVQVSHPILWTIVRTENDIRELAELYGGFLQYGALSGGSEYATIDQYNNLWSGYETYVMSRVEMIQPLIDLLNEYCDQSFLREIKKKTTLFPAHSLIEYAIRQWKNFVYQPHREQLQTAIQRIIQHRRIGNMRNLMGHQEISIQLQYKYYIINTRLEGYVDLLKNEQLTDESEFYTVKMDKNGMMVYNGKELMQDSLVENHVMALRKISLNQQSIHFLGHTYQVWGRPYQEFIDSFNLNRRLVWQTLRGGIDNVSDMMILLEQDIRYQHSFIPHATQTTPHPLNVELLHLIKQQEDKLSPYSLELFTRRSTEYGYNTDEKLKRMAKLSKIPPQLTPLQLKYFDHDLEHPDLAEFQKDCVTLYIVDFEYQPIPIGDYPDDTDFDWTKIKYLNQEDYDLALIIQHQQNQQQNQQQQNHLGGEMAEEAKKDEEEEIIKKQKTQ